METKVQIAEEKAAIVKEMREICDKPITAESEIRFSKLKTDLAAVEARAARVDTILEAERTADTIASKDAQGRDWEARCRNYRLSKAIAKAAGMNVKDAGEENEVTRELEMRHGVSRGFRVPVEIFQRAATVSSTKPVSGSGGALISTDFRADLYIDMIRERTLVDKLGATYLSGLSGDVAIPRGIGGTTAHWFNEDAVIPSSAATFGQLSLTPRHVGAIAEYSRNMLIQSNADAILKADLAQQIAAAIDAAAFVGSGSNGEPLGLLSTEGTTSVAMGTNGGDVSWDAIQKMELAADEAFVTPTGWVTNAKVLSALRSTTKVSGDSGAGFIAESRTALDGLPLFTTSRIPATYTKGSSSACSALILGNFADMLIAQWGTIELVVNPYASDAYSRGNVALRVIQTLDISVRHPASFIVCKDITTTA